MLPVLGVLIYLILRPASAGWGTGSSEASYHRDWEMGEIETLVRWRNQGTITDEEYLRIKERVIAA